jgi:tRNA threonylcarbamoyl adenosine modification protein YeaZ
MTVLAIDTSTARGTVALLRNGVFLLDEVFTADRSQSSALFPILERARTLAPKLDVIAIGLGPGSYAGVRIAIATGLGLSCATGARLVGLASVAALETAAKRYIAIGDARRETFYFTRIEDGICTEGPLLLDLAALRTRLREFADWEISCPTSLDSEFKAEVRLPRASLLAQLAEHGRGILQEGDLEPLYLRDPHITTPKTPTAGAGLKAPGHHAVE